MHKWLTLILIVLLGLPVGFGIANARENRRHAQPRQHQADRQGIGGWPSAAAQGIRLVCDHGDGLDL